MSLYRRVHPTMVKVIERYKNIMTFRMHLFPLPYHNNAFKMSIAAHGIANQNKTKIWDWVDAVFSHQDSFGNAVTASLSQLEIQRRIASLGTYIGLPPSAVHKALEDDEMDSQSRISWKFGCSKGVSGTPTFSLNGVFLPAEASMWGFSMWRKFLDNLISNQLTKKGELPTGLFS